MAAGHSYIKKTFDDESRDAVSFLVIIRFKDRIKMSKLYDGKICYILAFIPFQAGSMVEDIRNAFKELLMESRWMNRATQVISCVNNRYMYIQKMVPKLNN